MADKKKGHILVVEDDRNSRLLLVDFLSAHGWRVSEAEDGLTAIELAKKEKFAAVILDLRLPGENGLVVARRLRSQAETAGTPVIVTSAFVDQANKMKAYQAGANFFLGKPVDLEELLHIVQNAVRGVGES
ncbi:MAG: response regulator [Gracilibacteraceae bacterium]|jgi:DNA-binding response OmpR family regulator|nr:response regulator [Gracilibacteraceae bacterium]